MKRVWRTLARRGNVAPHMSADRPLGPAVLAVPNQLTQGPMGHKTTWRPQQPPNQPYTPDPEAQDPAQEPTRYLNLLPQFQQSVRPTQTAIIDHHPKQTSMLYLNLQGPSDPASPAQKEFLVHDKKNDQRGRRRNGRRGKRIKEQGPRGREKMTERRRNVQGLREIQKKNDWEQNENKWTEKRKRGERVCAVNIKQPEWFREHGGGTRVSILAVLKIEFLKFSIKISAEAKCWQIPGACSYVAHMCLFELWHGFLPTSTSTPLRGRSAKYAFNLFAYMCVCWEYNKG